MNQKGNLTRAERLEIGILLGKGYSLRKIAKVLGRSPNTLSYELRKNSVLGAYHPRKADAKARVRKRFRKLQWSKINADSELEELVIAKLKKHWNPDEIAGWLKQSKKRPYASKTAIYDWLRTARGERYCEHLYSKRKRIKKRRPKAKKALIPNRVGIAMRPAGSTNRSRYGHWERDSVVSKKGTPGGMAVHQERKSRLVLGVKVASMRPTEHARATRLVGARVVMKSATTDNGIENREHGRWGTQAFFCDAYSSWQKGGVENANKMLRRYFPKGTDFRTVTQRDINRACAIINDKPRRILGYRSARELATKAGIIKNESVLIQG
ncbi:MAG: IS30 family transposase [Patescibacteria group bacterium]|nr:IS30 family transposase [Patescibacteria group bacterium]